MGRPGVGGRSGGGHSSSGGGHRPSQSSSPSRGSHSSPSSYGRNSGFNSPPRVGFRHSSPPRGRFGRSFPPPRVGRFDSPPRHQNYGSVQEGSRVVSALITVFLIGLPIIFFYNACFSGSGIRKSNRTDSSYHSEYRESFEPSDGCITITRNIPSQPFNSDCVIDNDDWFDGKEKGAGKSFEFFYDTLGIQPYIVINGFISSLSTDSSKTAYAIDWYNTNLADSDTLLIMYFAEFDPNEVGYFAYAFGDNVKEQLETIEPLIDEGLDRYYFEDISSEEMFKKVFQYVTDNINVR
ncbi:MAG: hypothetical protein K2N56_01740 [Oscillospiraceae bacterium]|nr:hypothetical protein [Oscillospiraceae bacterium]